MLQQKMKIAVVYNSPAGRVLQHRGPLAHEVFPPRNIERIVEALSDNGHQVVELEADCTLIERLTDFFAPLDDDRWPGLVFNLAFGMQGELRYSQVPGLLELLGLPYLGSGPWGHALATDKATAKAVFRQQALPTADFLVVRDADFPAPAIGYPLVVKPVAEASSHGVWLVHDEAELRARVREDLQRFHEPVMLERFLPGRELNVSLIGNGPALQALPPVEVVLEKRGLPLYTREDKAGIAERRFELHCPAPIPPELSERLQQLAVAAFRALNCRDWARVEFRLDAAGQPYLLEVNTIPGLGRIASMPVAAQQAGIETFPALIQRLVEVAVERYRRAPLRQGSGT
ncbi:ATP-grasp domain-containing protein [Thiohalobacter sp. IOR34]|uniref:D-alanine--D-alanine ligase family protein n=1 Tax=Thiohalobacter sp. IOR34 TaxID=3057176 RepID=UPI0025B04C26|nr:ATP-grasp domain-containing protein [Thiohalobacter sp. IOR34]WJW76398.1 ATP-grasp domain-containing protein [Thiohalobacter sp. IOR34]